MTSRLCLLLLSLPGLLASLPCQADPAAPLALGRLFYTPAQRQAIDQQARGVVSANAPARVEEMRLDGIVTSSDGRSTVWINGEPAQSNAHVLALGERSARMRGERGRGVEIPVGGTLRLISDNPAP